VYFGEKMEIPEFVFPAVMPSNKFRVDTTMRNNPSKGVGVFAKMTLYFEFRKNQV
jgi:hypothetical protein